MGGDAREVVGTRAVQHVVAQEIDERVPLGGALDRDGDPRVGPVAAVDTLWGVVVAAVAVAPGATPDVLAASTDSPASASNVSSWERSTWTAAPVSSRSQSR